MKRILLLIFISVFLTGCATYQASLLETPQKVAANTTLKYDKYEQSYDVRGFNLIVSTSGMAEFFGSSNFFVEAHLDGDFKKDGSDERIVLFVHLYSQGGWKFLNSAKDSDGNPLQVYELRKNVDTDASITEDISVELNHEYLEKRQETGLDIRISGDQGSLIVKIPNTYVSGFLDKYDQYLRQVKPPPAIIQKDAATKKLKCGINFVKTNEKAAQILGMKEPQGVVVVSVVQDSVAFKAGLKQGDVILKYGKKVINDETDLQAAIAATKPGSRIPITIWDIHRGEIVITAYFPK